MILYYLYTLFSFLLLPFLGLFIIIKEYKKIKWKIIERFAVSKNKNDFSKKIIWIHAASIGEINIAIMLIEEINKIYGVDAYQFLVTTSNSSSSSEIVKNASIKNVIHNYVFIDNILFSMMFYSKWRPVLGIFIEAEIFPSMINYIGKKTNLILLNARISDSSYNKWLKIKSLFKYTVENFKIIITQSKYDYQKYKNLISSREHLMNLGNIKYARKVNTQNLIHITRSENKLVVVAGSTYEGEEIGILSSLLGHIKSKKILLILVPRYLDRIEKIKNQIAKYDLNLELRSNANSKYKIKVSQETDVYLVDSFGELNSFYKIADISIVGNSFIEYGTGHNIIEPANFNSIICFGSNMREFAEVSEEFVNTKSGIMLKSYSEITELCNLVINNKNLIEEYSSNAKELTKKYHGILNLYMEQIDKFIK